MDTPKEWKWAKTILPLLENYGDTTYNFLRSFLSDEQISLFLSFVEDMSAPTLWVAKDKITQEYQQPREIFSAIKALAKIRHLHDQLEYQEDDSISLETAVVAGFMCMHDGLELGLALEGANKETLKRAAEHGNKFLEAGKLSKPDALAIVLEDIVRKYRADNSRLPEYMDVINILKKQAKSDHETIQEVRSKIIYWKRKNGTEEKTSYKQLQNRLTTIRKKYSAQTG